MRRSAPTPRAASFAATLVATVALGSTAPVAASTAGVEEARLDAAVAALPGVLDGSEPAALLAAPAFPDADAAIGAAHAAGRALWARHAHPEQLDDRPLYWQRLDARRTLLRAEPPSPLRAAVLHAFEWASRGADDLTWSPDARLRVLVTGFDPFLLDRDIGQSNPSGVAALALDGARIGDAEVRTLLFPVRYDDFDAGLVEALVGPLLRSGTVDLVLTVSMGRDAFDLERFPGRRRSATAPDNRNRYTGADATTPVIPTLGAHPLPGPEFVEFSLPVDAMTALQAPDAVRDRRTVTTLEDGEFDAPDLAALDGRTAVRGSGGGYLSNEISFRTVRLAREVGSAAAVGHLHTPRIAGHDAERMAGLLAQIRMLLARAVEETGAQASD